MDKFGKKPQKEAEKSVRKDQKIENKKQSTPMGLSKPPRREEPKAPKKNN